MDYIHLSSSGKPVISLSVLYPIYISKNKFTYVVAFKGRDRK